MWKKQLVRVLLFITPYMTCMLTLLEELTPYYTRSSHPLVHSEVWLFMATILFVLMFHTYVLVGEGYINMNFRGCNTYWVHTQAYGLFTCFVCKVDSPIITLLSRVWGNFLCAVGAIERLGLQLLSSLESYHRLTLLLFIY